MRLPGNVWQLRTPPATVQVAGSISGVAKAEKSPDRIAAVGTVKLLRNVLSSWKPSKFDMKNTRFLATGPAAVKPY